MTPPPPGPATNGIVTPRALAVATAASTALPPSFRTSMPAWLAPGSIDATAPPLPVATGVTADPPEVAWLADLAVPALAQAGTATRTAATAATAEIVGKPGMAPRQKQAASPHFPTLTRQDSTGNGAG